MKSREWNWDIFLTSARRSKITLGSVDWRSTKRKNGNGMSLTLVKRLIAALEPDEVVLGAGNAKKLDALPAGTQAGDNDNAFRGGFRLWEKSAKGAEGR